MSWVQAAPPPLRTLADVEAFEAVPLAERLAGLACTFDVLVRAAQLSPEAEALVFLPDGDPAQPAQTLSYRQLREQVTQAANLFHSLGVGPGDVVAYALPNLLATHVALWGAQLAGAACALNPMVEAGQLTQMLGAVQARVLVTLGPTSSPELWSKVQLARASTPSLKAVLVVGEPGEVPGVASFERSVAAQPADVVVSGRAPGWNDTAALFFTGGTTGTPKVARHTHLNELADVVGLAFAGGLKARDTLLAGLPLFHVNGVIVTGLAAFFAGARVVLLGAQGYRQRSAMMSFWKTVERFEATFFSAVPTVLAGLLSVPRGEASVGSLRFALCGASTMPPELIRRFEEVSGLRVLEGYGLTEGTCVSAVNPRGGERRPGTVGLRLPYQQLKTVELDAQGQWVRDCGVDEIGCLVTRGPNVFPGYTLEAANRGVWHGDGWFDTGDLARMDREGYIWLTGRRKDLIIRGGHNLDPAVIEDAMLRHPAVAMAAAVGRPDSHLGELPVVFVQLRPGAAATPEELLAHAAATVAERAAVPVEVHLRETLPLTPVGKVFKPALRTQAIELTLGRELALVAAGRATFAIAVTPDPRVGTRVEVSGRWAGGPDPSLDGQLRERLQRHAMHIALSWT